MKEETKELIKKLYREDTLIREIITKVKEVTGITISTSELYAVIPHSWRRYTKITPEIQETMKIWREEGRTYRGITEDLKTNFNVSISKTQVVRIVNPGYAADERDYQRERRKKTQLNNKRKRFQREFKNFMERGHHDDWSEEDDQLLREVTITYIEMVTGEHGAPLIDSLVEEFQRGENGNFVNHI